jgi:hypothetical protein
MISAGANGECTPSSCKPGTTTVAATTAKVAWSGECEAVTEWVDLQLAIGRWEWGAEASSAASDTDTSDSATFESSAERTRIKGAVQAELVSLNTHLPNLRKALSEIAKVSAGDVKMTTEDGCCALTTVDLPTTLLALNEAGVAYTATTWESMASSLATNHVPLLTFETGETDVKLSVPSLLPLVPRSQWKTPEDATDFATAVWALDQRGEMVMWARLNADETNEASATVAAASSVFDDSGDVRISAALLSIPLGVTHLTPHVHWKYHGVWTGPAVAVPSEVSARLFTSSSLGTAAASALAQATAAAEKQMVAAMASWEEGWGHGDAVVGEGVSEATGTELAQAMVAAGGTWVLMHGQVEATSWEEADAIARRVAGWSTQQVIADALGIPVGGSSAVLMLQSPLVVESPTTTVWYETIAPWQWGAAGIGMLGLLGCCGVGLKRGSQRWDGYCCGALVDCCQPHARRDSLFAAGSAPTHGTQWGDASSNGGINGGGARAVAGGARAVAGAGSPNGWHNTAGKHVVTASDGGALPFSAPNPIYSRTGKAGGGDSNDSENRLRM